MLTILNWFLYIHLRVLCLQYCFSLFIIANLIIFWHQSCRKSLTSEDKISTLSPVLGSDVGLCTEDSNEPLFDISSSPLADFHHYERLHQEMSHQVCAFLAIQFLIFNVKCNIFSLRLSLFGIIYAASTVIHLQFVIFNDWYTGLYHTLMEV